jgi:hypothetical protein
MASNHGADFGPIDPKVMEQLRRTPEFGATGKYPEGHLTPDDEGELQFGITNTGGQVIINFGKPVAWLGMQPQQAIVIAEALLRHAQEARILGGNRHERRAAAAKHRSTVS